MDPSKKYFVTVALKLISGKKGKDVQVFVPWGKIFFYMSVIKVRWLRMITRIKEAIKFYRNEEN